MRDQLSSTAAPASTVVTPGCDCYVHRFGSIAPGRRAGCYPSDMTDAEWSEVRAVMPVPAWLLKRGGRPEAYCHRTMLDAVRYLVDNGVKWTAPPVDFPYWRAVYDFFRRWRAYDYARELYERLRRSARQRAGRNAEPSAGFIDSQSVDASETVGEDSRGYDGGKSRDGRKRHILTDTDGLLDAAAPLAARVAANDVQGEPQIKPQVPHVFRAFAGLFDETAAGRHRCPGALDRYPDASGEALPYGAP